MGRGWILPVFVFFCLNLKANDWIEVTSETHDILSVSFLILESPDLADENWLKFEVDNKSGKALPLSDAYYRIDFEVFDGQSGLPVKAGSVTGRNPYEFFESEMPVVPTSDFVLPAGKQDISLHPSSFAAAFLGLPDDKGYKILSTVSLSLESPGKVSILWEDLEFRFDWGKPKDSGLLVKRAKDILNQSQGESYQPFLLESLLSGFKGPSSLSLKDCLSALASPGFTGASREVLLQYLNRNFYSNTELSLHARKALEKHDRQMVKDLSMLPALRLVDKEKLLLSCYDNFKGKGDKYAVLEAFYAGISDASVEGRSEFFKRVSNDFEKEFSLDFSKHSPTQMKSVAAPLLMLGMTGAPEARSLICRFLSCTTAISDKGLVEKGMLQERVCDIAYKSLQLLDGKSPQEGFSSSSKRTSAIEKEKEGCR